MSTLTRRDPGPDKKTAEMNHSDAAESSTGTAGGQPSGMPSYADRRHQRAWIPGTAAFLTLLVGVSDIVAVFRPGWPHRKN